MALPQANPPYSLTPTPFLFGGLAALAGRAPLGGQREVALATYLAARLGHDALASRGVSPETRSERASHARNWLANVALPTGVRPALTKLVDASGDSADRVAPAVRAVMAVTASFLDRNARSELEQLAKLLGGESEMS